MLIQIYFHKITLPEVHNQVQAETVSLVYIVTTNFVCSNLAFNWLFLWYWTFNNLGTSGSLRYSRKRRAGFSTINNHLSIQVSNSFYEREICLKFWYLSVAMYFFIHVAQLYKCVGLLMIEPATMYKLSFENLTFPMTVCCLIFISLWGSFFMMSDAYYCFHQIIWLCYYCYDHSVVSQRYFDLIFYWSKWAFFCQLFIFKLLMNMFGRILFLSFFP